MLSLKLANYLHI